MYDEDAADIAAPGDGDFDELGDDDGFDDVDDLKLFGAVAAAAADAGQAGNDAVDGLDKVTAQLSRREGHAGCGHLQPIDCRHAILRIP